MVCIIEDDASVLRALTRLLALAGHEAAAFSTAEEFLGSAARKTARCLVLDLHLPGLGGLEVQERLAEAGETTPIILMSAFDEPAARAHALKRGAAAFLRKPFDNRTLLDAVEACLASGTVLPRPRPR